MLSVLWLYLLFRYRMWHANINFCLRLFWNEFKVSLSMSIIVWIMAAANTSTPSSAQISAKKKSTNSWWPAYCSSTTHLSQWLEIYFKVGLVPSSWSPVCVLQWNYDSILPPGCQWWNHSCCKAVVAGSCSFLPARVYYAIETNNKLFKDTSKWWCKR